MDAVISNLGPILIGIVSVVFLALSTGLIKKYCAKLDIESKAKVEEMLFNITQQAVGYAEQWAKNKAKTTNEKAQSPEKLHKAMEFIAEQIRKYEIDKIVADEVEKKVESMLGLNTLQQQIIETEEGDNDNEWEN